MSMDNHTQLTIFTKAESLSACLEAPPPALAAVPRRPLTPMQAAGAEIFMTFQRNWAFSSIDMARG